MGFHRARGLLTVIVLWFLSAYSSSAQDINYTEVKVSTNIEALIDFDVRHITDGVVETNYPSGFAFASSKPLPNHSGYIDFDFKHSSDLTSVEIWNGIDGGIPGILNFKLEFFNAGEVNVSDYPPIEPWASIDPDKAKAQLINFKADRTKNIRRVRLHFQDAFNRGIREVRFQGKRSEGATVIAICPDAAGCTKVPQSRKLIFGGLALLGLAVLAAIIVAERRVKTVKLKRRSLGGASVSSRAFSRSMLTQPKPENSNGLVFASSPLIAGATTVGPSPLGPLGQMIPSGLQTLTGQFAVLKPAYLATGRIGGPQEGVPTNDDVAFGTGFLITPNHVMTNQHVYDFYKHYLAGEDCGGIEFIAELDSDDSDYVPFDGEPPINIPGLDIVIFKLARAVTNRTPIDQVSIPTNELESRDVVIISYPCPFEIDDDVLSVVEKKPVFAVKRLSQGRIFRHSTDTDTNLGVSVKVEARINTGRQMEAICHNASTLGGSSGAPILDMQGKLVGVHFAGDKAFNGQESANLAMAIQNLVEANPHSQIA